MYNGGGSQLSLKKSKYNINQYKKGKYWSQQLVTNHHQMNYIKRNNKWAHQRGTTLVELSVVIAVILLLIGVLFIGVQAWRDGANRAACLVNISSVQKAVRGYENLNTLNPGASLAWTNIAGTGLYFETQPTCPSGGTYTLSGTIPAEGTAALACSITGHAPANTANW